MNLDFIVSGLRLSTPLLFAALGGVLAERSGVVNLALEGKLLLGAFAAAAISLAMPESPGRVASAFLGGAVAGSALASLLALWAVHLRANAIVVGVALNLLAVGVSQFLLHVFFGSSANSPTFSGLGGSEIPWSALGALTLGVILHGAFHFTRFGLRVVAVGEHPEAVRSRGVDPARTRTWAVLIAGAVAGLGGAYLALDTGQFVKNMSAGRGFIALAAVIFGKWNPLGAMAACLLFGFAEALQIRLQGAGVPTQFVQMIPYVLTMVALAGWVGRSRAPASLGQPLAPGSSR